MDVRLPDGTIIKDVPDGTTKADLVGKLHKNGMAVPADWLAAAAPPAPPTDRQRLLSSVPMRLAKGGKDPIDGGAQLLANILPEPIVRRVNAAADFVGGEGTFLGDVLGIKSATPQSLTNDIRRSDAEYETARKAVGQDGTDVARFVGNVGSPVNAVLGAAAPVGKVANTVGQLAAKGAIGGALGALTQPVMSDDYALGKAGQVAVGAATGGVLTPALIKGGAAAATAVRNRMAAATPITPEAIQMQISASLARDDIDVGQIPQTVMARLQEEAQRATAQGREVDAAAMLRQMDFDRAGVRPLLGQVTRDPAQYTSELNMRGIQGVGEPITNRLAEQQGTIASRFRRATSGAASEFDAGQTLIGQLQRQDAASKADVRASYQAFKESTGKDLEVPLGGLAQDYAATLRDFADEIPSAVRKQFESLGLLTGKQQKVMSIDDAENIIKTINKNYDPAKRSQARALDELRQGVEGAIVNVTDSGAGMEAAGLANMARDTAAKRFQQIRDVPALKAAINSAAPDDFVKKYVINGKVGEINRLADLAGPEGRGVMQQQMMRYLENKAFGSNAAGDGAATQASFNKELNAIGRNKLAALLGPEQAEELFGLGRVMAYIQQRPAGAAVNESNTGAAVANMVGKIGGTIKGAPYIKDFIINPLQNARDRSSVQSSLSAQLPQGAAQLEPETANMLARLLAPAPVAAGAALGYSVR